MSNLQLQCPAEWPCLPGTNAPFEWSGLSVSVSWVVKHRFFLFRVNSCLGRMPVYPHLLLCRCTDGNHRSERFRVAECRYVGRKFLVKHGGMEEQDNNAVFVALKLIRVEKPEYWLLLEQGPVVSRGRRPDPVLRIGDFAADENDLSVLSHWMQNPKSELSHSAPYAALACEILPKDLFERCRGLRVSDPDHPFAADFQMNARLLARENPTFTFIDLFAGIGGFRIAMQQEGGLCTFASEIDRGARATYRENFGITPFGDITKDETKTMIPQSFDILCGGFPCQAFSLAGHRKGFEDVLRRGTLYRQIVQIAQDHQPKAIFCENVKGLLSSAEGQALQTISHDIEGAGYHIVFGDILDSMQYGVPQHRERLYIVALRNDLFEVMKQRNLAFPAKPEPIPGQHPRSIGDILEAAPVPKSYYLGQNYLNTLIRHRARHADSGHGGFGYIVRERDDIAGTLMCGGMGRERNMIRDENQPDWEPTPKMRGGMNDRHLRFLTVREWARLQGFPDYFSVPTSIQAGYKQFGNCVTIKTVRAVGRAILNLIRQCEAEVGHE